jgi:phthiocerol/phenolphthiocerol synthesis type-I polyketide synthase E
VVTNIESSHVYPNSRNFFAEVRRVLKPGGIFLYTDVLPVSYWDEVRTTFQSLEIVTFSDRDITPNVLASCDAVAVRRAKAFGGRTVQVDNFLAVPGSDVYEKMRSGAWQYRIVRAKSG